MTGLIHLLASVTSPELQGWGNVSEAEPWTRSWGIYWNT